MSGLLSLAPLFAPVSLVKIGEPDPLDLIRQFSGHPSSDRSTLVGVAAIAGTDQRTISECAINAAITNTE
jgi:hypothetical protein